MESEDSVVMDKELWKKFQGYGKIKRHKLAELIINHHLSNSLFGFFMKLLTMAHHRTGILSTCLRELLCVSGSSRKTLQKDLHALEEKGLLRCKKPRARWKECVSFPAGESPYVIEISDYLEYFEGTGEVSTQVVHTTREENTQVPHSTSVDIGQVHRGTGVNFAKCNDVSSSYLKDKALPNKHNNKHNNNHHQGNIDHTSVNNTQVVYKVTDDDVFWFQKEFEKRTNNHRAMPLINKETALHLLGRYGRERVSLHLLRLDLVNADNPPGLLISSLENPDKYACLRMMSKEEILGEEKRKEEARKKKEEEKRKQVEEERLEYEKKKEIWDSLDNTTRKRYIDRTREIILEENRGASNEILRLNLLDLNVSTRAMQLYFKEKELCKI